MDVGATHYKIWRLIERIDEEDVVFLNPKTDNIKYVIEAVLFRVKLPNIYFFGDKHNSWKHTFVKNGEILKTIYNFIKGNFPLDDDIYWKDLPRNKQRIVEEYSLPVYEINDCNTITEYKEIEKYLF